MNVLRDIYMRTQKRDLKMYLDADVFLGWLKVTDWLKPSAEKVIVMLRKG